MPQPLNPWAHEPYAPHYEPDYRQEQQGHVLRLPPPSSLVSGSHPSPSIPNGREPAAYSHDPYRDPYFAVPVPTFQRAQQLPMPGSKLHAATLAPITRSPADIIARLSPTQSSTASDRSEDLSDHLRLRQLVGDQSSLQAHRSQPQPEQIKESFRHPRHAELQPIRPPPNYPTPIMRPAPSSQPITSPRQTLSPQSESRAAERMKISDLLSDEPRAEAPTSSKVPVRSKTSTAVASTYTARVRQQPVAARACGFGERDRRVIDPPPIVQVSIEDPNASKEEIMNRLKNGHSVIHCTIWDETGDQDCSAMTDDYRQQRRLMGTVVSSPFVGKDENNEYGCFFCFPDLSCRTPGSFRLKFSLVVLDPKGSMPGFRTPVCAVVMSEVFTVYIPKDFPGMMASSVLTRRLKEQGCLISIKKGNEKSARSRDESDDDDDDDDEEDNTRQRRSKRSRRS
ncbi:Uu.00g081150.m01.CDS01 [Anthostomella pinea]|uniref:Uu.00g081150.m01.CDS01 n=1 Tax=Anthostomella pinea TaxID=933095 RepID=A0AAI8YGZ8_9PEZI|nr:Uu.00g081150.m01.CDS01 [Anthostomella pinea]